MSDPAEIARKLHDLRFDIQDMAGEKHDAMGRWLYHIASKIEDIEFEVVQIAEGDSHVPASRQG